MTTGRLCQRRGTEARRCREPGREPGTIRGEARLSQDGVRSGGANPAGATAARYYWTLKPLVATDLPSTRISTW